MTEALSLDDVFEVMSAASVGDTAARVALPSDLDHEDPVARMAVALNILLDDLGLRTTELKRTEEQLRQAQKMEAIGRLAGGIAHDFNNLLTAIGGYATLLTESLPEGDDREMAREIEAASERAAALIRQLLAFGRRQIMEPRVLEPAEVVSSLASLITRIIGEDIQFRTIQPERPLRVRVDPTQLEQVLVNLIANARDAMPSGGRITVEVADVELDHLYVATHPDATSGQFVMIAVSDTGEGMTPEVRERIFEPFYTTREGTGGTGLGLATVYGIVKQSGGSVGVYSEPGEGTVFKVYLPRVFEPTEAQPTRARDAAGVRETGTILIAEDEEVVRRIAVLALSRAGYDVLEADSGSEAIALADRHDGPIALLVTDLVMREMSGRELADLLGPRRPEMRTLFVSGYAENTIVHHGILDPDVAFLAKPFTPTALVRKVRHVLQESGPGSRSF